MNIEVSSSYFKIRILWNLRRNVSIKFLKMSLWFCFERSLDSKSRNKLWWKAWLLIWIVGKMWMNVNYFITQAFQWNCLKTNSQNILESLISYVDSRIILCRHSKSCSRLISRGTFESFKEFSRILFSSLKWCVLDVFYEK